MGKINIVSLGYSQSNFLTQLYREIKLRNGNFLFHVDKYRDLSKGKLTYGDRVFESYHHFDTHRFSFLMYVQSFLKLLFLKKFWVFFWFEINYRKNIKGIFSFVIQQIKFKTIVDRVILPLNFDIYQFHFMKANKLNFIHYLPKNSRTVCSFWGSDLYRDASPYNAFYVKQALIKASNITIQTPEMAEDLYKKYGSLLKEKVVHAQFAIDTDIYGLMDLYEQDEMLLSEFKRHSNIPSNNIVLTIGYNANKAFKHIKILKQLNQLDSNIKKKLTCILPLTYSRNNLEYIEELYEVIDSISLQVVCFDSFMSHKDIAMLRLITDIQIQLPISDALSGSVTEVLYAGNIVLAGGWLPYGIYKRNDISIEILNEFDDLELEIKRIISAMDKLKPSMNVENKERIKNVFFPEFTTKSWINLYNNLAGIV